MAKLLPALLKILAGVGIGELLDKFLPAQYAEYKPDIPKEPKRLFIFVIFFALAAVIWGFVAKKIKLPRKYQ
ncbi:MAG: hypothetical protein U9O65_00760 [Thermotogota bacterium]|nr:hypothetical protein [Thermotogota bacterium]